MLLKIQLDGPGSWSTDSVVIFTVDGELTEVAINYGTVTSFTTLGGNRGVEITLHNQELLITRFTTAKEVWVTLPDANSGGRRSIKLSEPQLQIFRELVERYKSL